MLAQAVLIAQLTIVAVLVVSGLAKRREVQSTRSVLRLLKLPQWLQAPWVATALPWGELALAVALLVPVRAVAVLASIGVLVLFIAYWVVIARALRFNPRPACGCFGRIGDQSVTERTLVRNTLLVTLAVLGLVGSVRGLTVIGLVLAGGWLAGLAWAASLVCVVLIIGLPHRGRTAPPPAPVKPRPAPAAAPPVSDELDYVRREIPEVLLSRRDGAPVTMRELARQKAVLLLFMNCLCGPSWQVLAELDAVRRRLPALDVHAVLSMPFQHVHQIDKLPEVLIDHGPYAWRSLQLTSSPAAVLLGVDGLLAGGPVYSLDEIHAFVAEIEEQLAEAMPVGDDADAAAEPE